MASSQMINREIEMKNEPYIEWTEEANPKRTALMLIFNHSIIQQGI